jgi:Zn ribbon nucleic-acid-binding protein
MNRKKQREGARICRQEKEHKTIALYTEDGDHTYNYCVRCGKMHIARAALLKALLPGLTELFGMEYEKYQEEKA